VFFPIRVSTISGYFLRSQFVNVLETKRLNLRHLMINDAPFILELLNEPAFIQNIGDRGVRTVEDAEAYILNGPVASYERHGFGLFLVELKEGHTAIGMCGLIKRDNLPDVDVGFAFLSRFWGLGYAFESAEAVMAFGHEVVGLKRIVAIVSPDNAGSIKVLQKIGLTFERMIRWANDGSELKLFGPPEKPTALANHLYVEK
jgi:RimJ/RimL family protein N-acetyltransferase